jgi:hypothetical protein
MNGRRFNAKPRALKAHRRLGLLQVACFVLSAISLQLAHARLAVISSLLQSAGYHLTLTSDPTFEGAGGFWFAPWAPRRVLP